MSNHPHGTLLSGDMSRPSSGSALSRLSRFPWGFFFMLMLLSGVGLAVLFSASGGLEHPGRVLRQGGHLLIGVGVMMVMALANEKFYRRNAYLYYFFCVGLLVLVLVTGTIGMGARRWLNLYFFRLQPSELMKVAVVLALARYFHDRAITRGVGWKDSLVAITIAVLPMGLIVVQPDLGTSLLVAMTGGVVIFVAGLPWKAIFSIIGGVAAAAPVIWNYLKPYQQDRIMTFIFPERDPLGKGYHIIQSWIAVGSGGMFGKGYLNGSQSHLNFLPEQHTDFIFSVLAEEWGFVGAVTLLLIYCVLILQGLLIAAGAKDRFGMLLAAGLTASFSFPVIINMGMVIGLLPVVGMPLPLVSYGGSSMLTIMVGMGLMAHVHIHSKHPGRGP